MQGFVDNARQYLESEQGQQLERQIQSQFMDGKKENENVSGSADQGQDSTSGMNSAPFERQGGGVDTHANNESDYTGADAQAADEDYKGDSADTTSSGGYGTNSDGDSFSASNQSGIGSNSSGQFGGGEGVTTDADNQGASADSSVPDQQQSSGSY